MQNENTLIPKISADSVDSTDRVIRLKGNVKDRRILQDVVGVFGMSVDAIEMLDVSKKYGVVFPPALIKKMKEHDVQFLKDKLTGELLPTLYDYSESGFAGQVRLTVKEGVSRQAVGNFLNSFEEYSNHCKMDELIQELRDISIVVAEIKRGQETDRYAKIVSGKRTLEMAMAITDDDGLKKQLLAQAIAQLHEGYTSVGMALQEKLNSVESVPDGLWKQIWLILCDPNYLDGKKSQYEEIKEHISYYCLALEEMSIACAVANKEDLIPLLMKDARSIFEHKKLDEISTFRKLKIVPDTEMWFETLPTAIEGIGEGPIMIELTGEDLQEALAYGK